MKSFQMKRKNAAEQTRDLQPDLLHNLFFQRAKKYAQRQFLYSNEQFWTYASTSIAVKKLAASLNKLGVSKKEKVSIISPNYPELIISKLALSLLGLVSVPLNYRLGPGEFDYLIRQSDSSYIITIDKWRKIDYIASLRGICPEVFEGKESKEFPYLKKIIVFSPGGHKYDGTYDFFDLVNGMEESESNKLANELMKANNMVSTDIAEIMYTSGTTSSPKGVLVTHEMMWRAALGSVLNRGYEEGRRIYVPIPLYHCFGYIVGLIGATMVGGCIILQDDFDEYAAINIIQNSQADDMLCVPTIAIRLLKAVKSNNAEINLTAMYCAGAEVPSKLWVDLKNTLRIKELITGYGMTELAGGVLQTDPEDDLTFLSKYVGKTIPGGYVGLSELNGYNIEFKIREVNNREFLPAGKEGELVCRGPLVTNGYYKKEKETFEAFEDGWLNTGDLGIIDENGYIMLTGRIKEIYRIGAENVAPKEIEEALTLHEKVNQAYVIGVPDIVLGEVGMAYVVLEDNACVSEEELLSFVSKRLARYKIPKYIQIINEVDLPKTATGKVQKFILKERYSSEKDKLKNLI